MFGHGQIEGYSEKYGMEYRRAYLDEFPDQDLVSRHQREIFPLIHQRHLFSGVEQFRMYDFHRPDGSVDEDVFAYTNGFGDNRILILFLNKYASTDGTIHQSTSYLRKSDGQQLTGSLSQNFGLHDQPGFFTIFHDHIRGLDHLIPSQMIAHHGLRLHLDAYQYYAFSSIQEVSDDEFGSYQRLFEEMGNSPIANIHDQIRMIRFRTLHRAFSALFQPALLALMDPQTKEDGLETTIQPHLDHFLMELARFLPTSEGFRTKLEKKIGERLRFFRRLSNDEFPPAMLTSKVWRTSAKRHQYAGLSSRDAIMTWCWIIFDGLIDPSSTEQPLSIGTLLDELSFSTPLADILMANGIKNAEAWFEIAMLRSVFLSSSRLDELSMDPSKFWKSILDDTGLRALLGVNQTGEHTWVYQEAMLSLCNWLERLSIFNLAAFPGDWTSRVEKWLLTEKNLENTRQAIINSGCRVDLFLELLKTPIEPPVGSQNRRSGTVRKSH